MVQHSRKTDLGLTFLRFTCLAATNHPRNQDPRSVSNPFRKTWSSGFVGQQVRSTLPWYRASVMTHPPGIVDRRSQSHQFHVFPFILRLGFVYREVGRIPFPTYLILDRDLFLGLLNHEGRPETQTKKITNPQHT